MIPSLFKFSKIAVPTSLIASAYALIDKNAIEQQEFTIRMATLSLHVDQLSGVFIRERKPKFSGLFMLNDLLPCHQGLEIRSPEDDATTALTADIVCGRIFDDNSFIKKEHISLDSLPLNERQRFTDIFRTRLHHKPPPLEPGEIIYPIEAWSRYKRTLGRWPAVDIQKLRNLVANQNEYNPGKIFLSPYRYRNGQFTLYNCRTACLDIVNRSEKQLPSE